MDVILISFQKIFALCRLKGHIVEIRWDVTIVHGRTDGRTTECEDRARILKQNSQFQMQHFPLSCPIPVEQDGSANKRHSGEYGKDEDGLDEGEPDEEGEGSDEARN